MACSAEQTYPTKFNAWRKWWQQSAKKQLTSFVQSEFERIVPTALSHVPRPEPPLFHRTEIETGKRLGVGGFSDVYEINGFTLREDISAMLTPAQRDARQKMAESVVVNGKCQYAIKYLQRKQLDNPEDFLRAAADLAIEASFLSALDHPHIASLKGTTVDGLHAYMDGRHDSFFLITERLQETLEDRVGRWRDNTDAEVPLLRKVEISQQLAEALLYLHQRRIVFRDLKPANIGFSAIDDSIILFDLGLSRELPQSDSATDVYQMSGVGTRRYMAVEAVLQNPYNCKVDVYGWSMILWEMLMLMKPFNDLTYQDHTQRVCLGGERPYISSDLPHSVQRLLQRCWEESVSKRLTMDEVCHQLPVIQKEIVTTQQVLRQSCSVKHLSADFSRRGPLPIMSLFTTFSQTDFFSSKSNETLLDMSSSLMKMDSTDSTDSILEEWQGGGHNAHWVTMCAFTQNWTSVE